MTRARAEMIRLLDTLSGEELDDLPVGIIQLDRDGTVLQYNATESSLARFSRAEVVGRNFFTEIAPCTAVRDFQGRFEEGVKRGELDATFGYRFRFADERTKDVTITMSYRAHSDNVWVVVERP
ncbi:MAG TPA: PAS domain-containing protein [Longimicrobium sp.]|nr:PAS domain-containing protein [Longimicrobium sp.]